MTKHKPLPKIRGFHNVYKEMQINGLPSSVTWVSKIKLHGTNAGIRFSPDGTITGQKRTDDVSITNDNMDFALFVERNRDFLGKWYAEYRRAHPNTVHDVILCGEWAGPGVQKAVAVSQIPEKHFFIFGVMHTNLPEGDRSTMLFSSSAIRQMLQGGGLSRNEWRAAGFRILPEYDAFQLDPRFREGVQGFVEIVNKQVEAIEASDPYILNEFGIDGVGEGLVFYPHGEHGSSTWCYLHEFERLAFKVKGEKHAVNKAGKPARLKSEIPSSAYEFADQHVTEARLQQGLTDFGGEIRMEDTGRFIGWVCRDVATESAQEIAESGMSWKGCLSGVVANKAREFFIKQVEAI